LIEGSSRDIFTRFQLTQLPIDGALRLQTIAIWLDRMTDDAPSPALRRGWTTGSCAAAAARAAFEALLTGRFPDPVSIALPSGARPEFALALEERGRDFARAGVVKDAGDDPDVTHGALIVATVRLGDPGTGIMFRAGPGVGTVTRPGLPLPPGEPAINPVPRSMIRAAIGEAAALLGGGADAIVEISIPNGEKLAERTLNGRLGIVGGLSILGTTGIVMPYSCSAWIHSIHRGIDVARACGLDHVAGSTGSTSEAAIRKLHGLSEVALIDMGDFVGGMLKYIRRHTLPKVTIAGGFAKMTKLGQGLLDLHSRRGEVDFHWLAARLTEAGGDPSLAERVRQANTGLEALGLSREAGIDLPGAVAEAAWTTAAKALRGSDIALEVAIFDRAGALLAKTPFRPAHH
jgi:cobalt-precorrin-5B (C1)-methyltransferase